MATRGVRSRCRSQADRASRGTAEQPSGAGSTSLLASATTWPLKRYGRFLSPTDSEDGERSGHSWKVTVWRPPLGQAAACGSVVLRGAGLCVGAGAVSVLLSRSPEGFGGHLCIKRRRRGDCGHLL